ncbi:MAG TPA: ferredoxin family protein [Acidimicrobiales bacterium]|nr:ferredoxin family protein [Acidimicrobiales bacterium]
MSQPTATPGEPASFGDEPVPASASRRTDPAKVRAARANPNRPGEKCRAEPGRFVPVVDLTRCEGKRDCTDVCPYDVFDVTRIADSDFAALSTFGKLRSIAHKRQAAYAVRAEDCHACGLCVVACPEAAITLRATT